MRIYLCAALVAFVVSGAAFAQGPDPRPGATTPVKVTNTPDNPVPVIGTLTGEVKVADDIVNSPYIVSHSNSFVGGNAAQLEFDIPDGMRLIVETITVRFALETPGSAVAQLGIRTAGGVVRAGELALQPQGTITDDFGTSLTWIVGTHSIKLRVDAQTGRDDELIIFPRFPVVRGTSNAFVAGYLVPIQ